MTVSDASPTAMRVSLSLRRRGIDALAALAVSLLAAILLIYIGYAEARRGLPALRDDRAAAMGSILAASLTNDPDPAAFVRRATAAMRADAIVAAVALFDRNGETLASLRRPAAHPAETPATAAYEMPLDGGGHILLLLDQDLDYLLGPPFERLLAAAIILSLGAALLATAARERLGERGGAIAGGVLFALTAGLIALALANLQLDSQAVNGRVLATTLAETLADAPTPAAATAQARRMLGRLPLAGIDGAALRDERIVAHSDARQVGQPWRDAPWTDLPRAVPPLAVANGGYEIRVETMALSLLDRPDIRRMAKNFAALLLASGFIAHLFRQMVAALRADGGRLLGVRSQAKEIGEATLERVKPIFFLAVLVENMGYAFLPALLKDVAAGSGLPPAAASALFMSYFFGFALILVPSGQMAGRYGPKPLITFGAGLVAVGLFLMALTLDALAVGTARFMTGVGQGMILIGVQSYILEVAAVGHRTRGTAIIVFGFNTGMIAGIALGSLLVEHLKAQGVFLLSAIVTVILLLFTQGLLPALARPAGITVRLGYTLRELGRNTARAMTSLAFIRATFMVGVPNKAVMTGVILFALPLLLSQQGMNAEDIGQIVMFYAAGMLITSPIVSRLVDMVGETRRVMFIGSLISGFGLLLIGATASPWLTALPHGELLATGGLVAAVLIIGAAHGFVNAPVVTHVAELAISREVGSARVAATYRFLERMGHVAGPILVGQALQWGGQNAGTITWVGAVVIICALLFRVRLPERRKAPRKPESYSQRRRTDPHG